MLPISRRIQIVQPQLRSKSLASRRTSTLPCQNPTPKPIRQSAQFIDFNHHNSFCNCLFSKLNSPPHLLEAKRLHGILVVNGSFLPTSTDSVFGSQLVNIYVKFGCLQDAFLVFNQLPNKNNLAWNAMLRGFLDVGQFAKALEFYHLMLSQGLIPDNFTFPLVLKACSGLNALDEGRKVRDFILSNEAHFNIKRNIYVECAMIDMFAKCGSLSEARGVFEEMPRKDLVSWNAMICGTLHNGEWFEAFCLLRRMTLEGIRPDSFIVAAILPACGRLEARQMGLALQCCAVNRGFERDLYVSNALIDMYCKLGDTHEAYNVFCAMVCKDVVTWTTLIAGYSQNCQYCDSFGLYLEMKSAGVRTNANVAASVLPGLAKLRLLKQGKEMHCYVLKQGFDSDAVVSSALIEMYTSFGLMRKAEYIFEIMSNTDSTIWNSLIVGYSLNGDICSAFATFQRMWESNIRPNSITLMSILPMCTRMGILRQGKEVHCYAIRSGIASVVSVGNSLVDMYCKCGFLELGENIFNRMMEKNIVTYNTMISAYGIYGLGEQVFSCFEQMKKAGVRPNQVTFVTLLSACSHAGLIDRGWMLYNSIFNDYHIMPCMEHYACMVDLLSRAGHLDDACNFIRGMPVEPDINVLGSLLGACRIHNRVELAELVGEEILRGKLKGSGHHVLLSNIYATNKRWSDALRVRIMIKENGLVKTPGCSCIQIDF